MKLPKHIQTGYDAVAGNFIHNKNTGATLYAKDWPLEDLASVVEAIRYAKDTENDCKTCNGDGVVDSGASDPWGRWIDIECHDCGGTGDKAGTVR